MSFLLLLLLQTQPLSAEFIETKSFVYCSQNRAAGSRVRTLGLQYFPDESSYLLLYGKRGEDSVECKGKWLVSCKSILNSIRKQLTKQFWRCKDYKKVDVFYSGSN